MRHFYLRTMIGGRQSLTAVLSYLDIPSTPCLRQTVTQYTEQVVLRRHLGRPPKGENGHRHGVGCGEPHRVAYGYESNDTRTIRQSQRVSKAPSISGSFPIWEDHMGEWSARRPSPTKARDVLPDNSVDLSTSMRSRQTHMRDSGRFSP